MSPTRRPTFARFCLLTVVLAVGTMGSDCSLRLPSFPLLPGPPGPIADFVDIVFVNETADVVQPFINGVPVDPPLLPGEVTEFITLDCFQGDILEFDGDVVTGFGNIPSQNTIIFEEGFEYLCGDVLEVHFFIDEFGFLTVDGFADF
jgi:hypothetical protein